MQAGECCSSGTIWLDDNLLSHFLLLYPWIEQEMSAGQMCWKRNVFFIQPSKTAQKNGPALSVFSELRQHTA